MSSPRDARYPRRQHSLPLSSVAKCLWLFLLLVDGGAAGGDLPTVGGRRQIVGLIPSDASLTVGAYDIEWVDIRWPGSHINITANVDARKADLEDPTVRSAVGAWADINFADAQHPSLTCRMDPETGSYLTCLERRNIISTPLGNGCCADTLRIYHRISRAVWSISTVAAVQNALAADGIPQEDLVTAYVTHTVDVHYRDGKLVYILAVRFNSYSQLGGMYADAAVRIAVDVSSGPTPGTADDSGGTRVINLPDAEPTPTAAGLMSFIPLRDLSTWSTDPVDSIYRIQYTPAVTNQDAEEWHMNGILSFRDAAGNFLLGVSLRQQNGPFIVTDPWEVEAIQIVQRFGTPHVYSPSGEILATHFFGVEPSEQTVMPKGCHNFWYTLYPDGTETFTIFSNQMGEDGLSKVVEFELKLAPQTAETVLLVDSVFQTAYTLAPLPYETSTGGGARTLSKGIYVASTGSGTGYITDDTFMGLVVTDVEGQYLYVEYAVEGVVPIYDCFTYVDIEEGEALPAYGHS